MNQPDTTDRRRRLAPLIDHTLLKPEATRDDARRLCGEALAHGFAAVCVTPWLVPVAAECLAGSPVKVGTVAGFPLGAADTRTKAFETETAVAQGAVEIDMVLAVGALKSGDGAYVAADVAAVVAAARGALVKVILETGLLTDGEKRRACSLAVAAGAGFVKTSTGFAGGPATVEDIRLMRAAVGPRIGVKASGGIRALADALAMIEAGANRLGTSAAVAIVSAASTSQGS